MEWSAEINLRAQRRAGELLSEMDKAKAGRPKKKLILHMYQLLINQKP
jgi:hypothetical protein